MIPDQRAINDAIDLELRRQGRRAAAAMRMVVGGGLLLAGLIPWLLPAGEPAGFWTGWVVATLSVSGGGAALAVGGLRLWRRNEPAQAELGAASGTSRP